MRTLTRSITLLFIGLALAGPAAALSPAETITVPDEGLVTRGDFIRASVRALGVPVTENAVGLDALPYDRVPKALAPYVWAAHVNGALTIFDSELLLARGITRGQAARIVYALSSEPTISAVSFRDAKEGTDLGKAVGYVIHEGWLSPIEEDYFGATRMLTGKDARLMLRKMAGEDDMMVIPGKDGPQRVQRPQVRDTASKPQRQTVRVQYNRATPYKLPKHQILETIWEMVQEEYLYDGKINQEEAAYSVAEALVESLDDPYTTFLRPVKNENFQSQIGGEITGIGAQVEDRDGILTVVTPLPESPALKAGILPNDQILSVDGVSLTGMNFVEAVDHVRGPKGSTAHIVVRRNGGELEITVIRDTIKIPEIDVKWQENIAVVRLIQFGKRTDTELRGMMTEIQSKNPQGIILDLRNNPGGLLHAADVVLSNFVPVGSDVAQINAKRGTHTSRTTDPPTINDNTPLIVLINEGSASASEIVAGAVQDHGRGRVIGTKSFGKGTVQQVVEFTDGSSIKMTIAEWYTPSGRRLDGHGIDPDIEVKQSEGERDEQLLKAIELLKR